MKTIRKKHPRGYVMPIVIFISNKRSTMNTITRLELLKRLAAAARLPISLEGNIFDEFDKAGLFRKFRRNGENLPDAAATRAELLQLIYNIEVLSFYHAPTTDDIIRIVMNLSTTIDSLGKHNAFADIDYNHPHDRAIYHAVANGYVAAPQDGLFRPETPLATDEADDIIRRFHGPAPTKPVDFEDRFKSLCANDSTLLTHAAAVNLFKKAALAEPDNPAIAALLNGIRQAARPQDTPETIKGSPDDLNTWIGRYSNGTFIREAHIQSKKTNTPPVEIVMLNDTHYNYGSATARPSASSAAAWISHDTPTRPSSRATCSTTFHGAASSSLSKIFSAKTSICSPVSAVMTRRASCRAKSAIRHRMPHGDNCLTTSGRMTSPTSRVF